MVATTVSGCPAGSAEGHRLRGGGLPPGGESWPAQGLIRGGALGGGLAAGEGAVGVLVALPEQVTALQGDSPAGDAGA